MTKPIARGGSSDFALFQSVELSQRMKALKSPGASSADARSIHQQNLHDVFTALFPKAMAISPGGPTPLTAFKGLNIEAQLRFMQKVGERISLPEKAKYLAALNLLTQQAARQNPPGADWCGACVSPE